MPKVSMSKKELEALRELLDAFREGTNEPDSVLVKFFKKAEQAFVTETAPAGISLAEISRLMAAGAPSKWAPHVAGNPARHLKMLHESGATDETVKTVAAWLERQTWMKSRVTLESLVAHWASWLSQATVAALEVVRPPRRRGPALFEEDEG